MLYPKQKTVKNLTSHIDVELAYCCVAGSIGGRIHHLRLAKREVMPNLVIRGKGWGAKVIDGCWWGPGDRSLCESWVDFHGDVGRASIDDRILVIISFCKC